MKFAVGTYTSLGGPGIALCEAQGGALRQLCVCDAVNDPIWVLCADGGRTLYAACEDDAGRGMVASFSVSDGALRLTAAQPSMGRACCHLALDEKGGTLYAANYLDASVAVFPVRDGRVMPLSQHIPHFGSGKNLSRQAEAHAHQAVLAPDGLLYVCDLGADRVAVYARDAVGLLREVDSIQAPAGSGPRHLLFAGRDAFYLAGEVDSTLSYYRRGKGAWTRVLTRSTLPDPCPNRAENTAAAIRMADNTVYVSNRGHDSIAAFSLDVDGAPSAPRFIPVPGRCPRDFIVTESGFLIAHQVEGGVALTDQAGAPLSSLPIKGAVCVCPMGS